MLAGRCRKHRSTSSSPVWVTNQNRPLSEPETGSLDQADVAALAAQAEDEASSPEEAAITQDDINALLQQMETHQPPAKVGQGAVDINSLMRAAETNSSGVNTVGLGLAPQGSGRQSAYLSKDEVRGARFILSSQPACWHYQPSLWVWLSLP